MSREAALERLKRRVEKARLYNWRGPHATVKRHKRRASFFLYEDELEVLRELLEARECQSCGSQVDP